MSQNYQRHQIILTESSAEFTSKGKKALGKCVLEAKDEFGKVSFSVSNLRANVICNAYIVAAGSASSSAISIGRVIADEKGNSGIKWECNANDVEGSGLKLSDFNVAGLMILDSNVISAPVIGHRDREVAWKNNLKVFKKSTEITQTTPQNDTEEIKEDEPQSDTAVEAEQEMVAKPEPKASEPTEPAETNVSFESSISKIITLEKADIPSLEFVEISEPEEFFETVEEGPAEKIFKDVAMKINEKLNGVDKGPLKEEPPAVERDVEILTMTKQTADGLENILRNCSKIRPFKDKDNDTQWVRITPGEIAFLPDGFKQLEKDYAVSSAYRKFNHLILGCKNYDDHLSISFGIPDIYSEVSMKSTDLLGFAGFFCCDSEEIKEGKHGYFLKTQKYYIDRGL